jgi:hypothetical protein
LKTLKAPTLFRSWQRLSLNDPSAADLLSAAVDLFTL